MAEPGDHSAGGGPSASSYNQADWRPRPDPTALTTAQLREAEAGLRTAIREGLAGLRELLEARLDGMDVAVKLLAEQIERIPRDADKQREHARADINGQIVAQERILLGEIRNVRDVTAEQFEAVNTRFLERDTRTEQAAQESRISLDAALAAAKEAVSEQNKANALAIGKSEDATKERLDALATLMTTSIKSLEDKIGDVKSRLDLGEGRLGGNQETRSERRLDIGQLVSIVAVLIAVAGALIAVLRK